MILGRNYNQLVPVAGNVRAGIVSYDGSKPEHRALLRKALPRFLGSVAAVHGAEFPQHQIETMIEIANTKEIEIDFFLVAHDACSPITIAGLATSVQTFGVEWDDDNNIRVSPITHGDDLAVDEDEAKLFREYTQSPSSPKGIGAGTWLMREQILRSISNPDWVFAGRDNEHLPDNFPIIRVMDKFGAERCTEEDSLVLQLDALTPDIKRRWGVNNVQIRALPADALGITHSPNNFMAHWASEDGKQQLAIVFTKLPSLLDDETVVWTKIHSNGNLPEKEMLKEILASMFSAGHEEISSPERRWGVPRTQLRLDNDLSYVFGGSVPTMHIHANNEPDVVQALLEMGAIKRKYGHGNLVSGVMKLKNISDPVSILGRSVPQPTLVTGIALEQTKGMPYFNVVDEMKVTVKGILSTKQTGKQTHFAAVDEISRDVESLFAKKPASALVLN